MWRETLVQTPSLGRWATKSKEPGIWLSLYLELNKASHMPPLRHGMYTPLRMWPYQVLKTQHSTPNIRRSTTRGIAKNREYRPTENEDGLNGRLWMTVRVAMT